MSPISSRSRPPPVTVPRPSRAARLEGNLVDHPINAGSLRGRGSRQGNRGLVVCPPTVRRPPLPAHAPAHHDPRPLPTWRCPPVLTGGATGLAALDAKAAFGLAA